MALPSRSYSWSPLCLQQSYYTAYQVSPSALQENRWHIHTYIHTYRLKTVTTIYSFSFYSSLCLEIAGSMFSLITLLDMMHQNLLYLFTGIHWIEHKVSQWIHDWRFAHCTYNSEWHFPDFLIHFFPFPSLSHHHLADHIHQTEDLLIVWQDILLCSCLLEVFSSCFTSTICIETIHRLDMFLNTSFVPLL